ncbi:hypothetical protein ACIRRA_41585 [Nocardia sp. NPDC101769]
MNKLDVAGRCLATDETRQLYCEPGANALTVLYYTMFRRRRYIKLRPA